MKVVILAGGFGTRFSEETHLKPKPMIEIGGKPILWHIMKIYSFYGLNEFIICCGYKGYIIKEYFNNYFLHQSNVTFDFKKNSMKVHHKKVEPWTVTLVETGEKTMTGGRLRQVEEYVKNEDAFCFTYGDGVADINIKSLIEFHNNQGKTATVTATRPPGRYGALKIDKNTLVSNFIEKPEGDGSWINGGFFVLNPNSIDYIDNDQTSWEADTLPKIAKDSQLAAYKHLGFWHPMDTLRDKIMLHELWTNNKAPWKVWK